MRFVGTDLFTEDGKDQPLILQYISIYRSKCWNWYWWRPHVCTLVCYLSNADDENANIDDSRKALASLLSKLTLPEGEEADNDTLKSVLALICAVRDKRPLSDAPSRNAVTKFESVLLKKWPQILEAFDEDAFRREGAEKEGVKELFGFIDDV